MRRREHARARALPLVAVALALALAWAAAACSSRHGPRPADKAGGAAGPVVLRLAAADALTQQPESGLVAYFARQVAQLSKGRLRVQVTYSAAGDGSPDVEARTIRLVRDGRFDLGWIPARAWDEVGVKSLQALQAPLLITDYALLGAVMTSPLAPRLLRGVETRGFVGLALVPALLRHPVGLHRPLVAPADFAGARVRDFPSRATDAVLRALGAAPVHVANSAVGRAIARGRIDGEELSLVNAPIGGIVTANVTLFPKTLTLVAGRRAFASLSDEQRAVLRAAARRTLRHNTGFKVRQALVFEGILARNYCRRPGRIALATDPELAALARAVRPVYAELERDPETRAAIRRIRALKASLPDAPPAAIPASCLARRRPAAATAHGDPGVLNGTYHWLLRDGGRTTVFTAVLRDGRFLFPGVQPPEEGTYTVAGNRLALTGGSDVTEFTFSRDTDGTLHLTPVGRMEPGDRHVLSDAPWRRVGPPRPIP